MARKSTKNYPPPSRRVTRKPKRLSPADLADSAAIIEIQEQPSSLTSTDALEFESSLWGRARTQWMLGDWDSLASLELDHLEQVPHRAELATLSACAQLQNNKKQAARKSLAAASRWNCDPAFMVRVLVAGSEASLARYHEICRREAKSLQLLASSAGALGGDGRLAATARKALASPPAREESAAANPSPKVPQHQVDDDQPPPLSLDEAIAAAKQEDSPGAKPGITSYAQNFEDVILWRFLGHIQNGFYIDIGAQHPVIDSVSRAFYEHGWRGLHVEPVKEYADLLRQDRPDEIVIEAAISDRHGESPFYTFKDTGMSTLLAAVVDLHRQHFLPERRSVQLLTLDDLFSYATCTDIHWLKIDVEGSESDVLKGWKGDVRPWVICIECTVPRSTTMVYTNWEYLLLSKHYVHVYTDGLNRFYVHNSYRAALPSEIMPPNLHDLFSRAAH